MEPGRILSRSLDGTLRHDWAIRSIGDLLDAIRSKPGVFLGRPHLSLLRPFVHGFRTACDAFGIEVEGTDLLDHEFHEFVAQRLGYRNSGPGWPNMLLEAQDGDDEAAFANFFRLLDDYRARPK